MYLKDKLEDLYSRLRLNTIYRGNDIFIPHALEAEYVQLDLDHHNELLLPENLEWAQKISALVKNIFLGVVLKGASGKLLNGQMTYNAQVLEKILHDTLGWEYFGLGDLDHECHHTGIGYDAADFQLDNDFYTNVLYHNIPRETLFPAGIKIDAKIYLNLDSAREYAVKESSWHDASVLLIYIMSDKKYYFAHVSDKIYFVEALDFLKGIDLPLIKFTWDSVNKIFITKRYD